MLTVWYIIAVDLAQKKDLDDSSSNVQVTNVTDSTFITHNNHTKTDILQQSRIARLQAKKPDIEYHCQYCKTVIFCKFG